MRDSRVMFLAAVMFSCVGRDDSALMCWAFAIGFHLAEHFWEEKK